MAFKKSTVNAVKVAAPLSDFPSYVDLSRAGITTLAQAQSSRLYADEAKLVEQAREIVSATEGHTKVASMSSTSELYIDYDGIRADYGVGDTYGRNAVWGAYAGVMHLNSVTNSVGVNNFTNTGSTPFNPAKIGDGAEFNGANTKKVSINNNLSFDWSLAYSWSFWVKLDAIGTKYIFDHCTQLGANRRVLIYGNTTNLQFWYAGNTVNSSAISIGSWYHVAITKPTGAGGTASWYVNGVAQTTRTPGAISSAATEAALGNTITALVVEMDGILDEARYLPAKQLSVNWITTEYNNQSSEATFWGDWADVAGTPTPDYTITAETGTFALTGTATTFASNYRVTAAPGAFSLTGNASGLYATRLVTADPATFTLAGTDTNILYNRAILAEPGAFTLAGNAAALLASFKVTADPAAYTVTANDAALSRMLRLACEPGTFALSGNDANLLVSYVLAAQTQAYTVTGNAADILKTYLLLADAGAFTLNGQNAELRQQYRIAAQTAALTLNASPAAILARYRLAVEPGGYVLAGLDADISVVAYIQPFCPVDSPFEAGATPFDSIESPFGPFAQGDCP